MADEKIKIDWRAIVVVIGLIGNIVWTAYQGGRIVNQVESLQDERTSFEQRIEKRLERIENLFLARPGGGQ